MIASFQRTLCVADYLFPHVASFFNDNADACISCGFFSAFARTASSANLLVSASCAAAMGQLLFSTIGFGSGGSGFYVCWASSFYRTKITLHATELFRYVAPYAVGILNAIAILARPSCCGLLYAKLLRFALTTRSGQGTWIGGWLAMGKVGGGGGISADCA